MTNAVTIANSAAVPQVTVYTSGSGTYTVPTNAKYLHVQMIGGGGGGGGSGNDGTGGAAGTGGTTTFGTSLLTCNGGTGGITAQDRPSRTNNGTATIGAGATGLALTGGFGGNASIVNQGGTPYMPGGMGAASYFGGGGLNGTVDTAPVAGQPNTGAGGGGAGGTYSGSQFMSGVGGYAGGFIDAIITSLASSYTYAVGAGGAAGTLGTGAGAQNGSAGGSGVIKITAYF